MQGHCRHWCCRRYGVSRRPFSPRSLPRSLMRLWRILTSRSKVRLVHNEWEGVVVSSCGVH
eukprot:32654-Eustigmatos_ZCMA.PRE.1